MFVEYLTLAAGEFTCQVLLKCVSVSVREKDRKRVLVVQLIIHVQSGQLHLANAALLSLLAAVSHLSASVKWTVNIDRETARGEQRPCQRERKRGRWREGRMEAWREGNEMERLIERESSCLLPRQLTVL